MIGYEEPLLIISHQALLRPLRAFLLGEERENCPSFKIPLHTVMKISWDGWSEPTEEVFPLGPDEKEVKLESGADNPVR